MDPVIDVSVEATTPPSMVQPRPVAPPAPVTPAYMNVGQTPPVQPVQTTVIPAASLNTTSVIPAANSKDAGSGGSKKLGTGGTVVVAIISLLILGAGLGVGVYLSQTSQEAKKTKAAVQTKSGGASFGWDGQCYSRAQTPASSCIVVRNLCPQMSLSTFANTSTSCNCVVTGPNPNDVDCSGNSTPGTGPVTREVLVGLGNDLDRCFANACNVQQLDVNCSGTTSFRSVYSDELPLCVQGATPVPTQPAPTNTPPPGPTPTSTCPSDINTQFWYGCSGEPVAHCGSSNLIGWVDGGAVSGANPSRPFPLAINCFANTGSLFTEANIHFTGPGVNSTIISPSARNIQIVASGDYSATCYNPNLTSCFNEDHFSLVGPTLTPTPVPPTLTPVPNQCQQITVLRNGQQITLAEIRKGDNVVFRGSASGVGVTAIRFVVTKNGVAQAPVDVPVVAGTVANTFTADLQINNIAAASYTVTISPVEGQAAVCVSVAASPVSNTPQDVAFGVTNNNAPSTTFNIESVNLTWANALNLTAIRAGAVVQTPTSYQSASPSQFTFPTPVAVSSGNPKTVTFTLSDTAVGSSYTMALTARDTTTNQTCTVSAINTR